MPDREAEFDEIEEHFDLGPDHKMLLAAARQAWRRWHQITDTIDQQSVVLPARYEGSSRAHPLLSIEVTARNALVQVG